MTLPDPDPLRDHEPELLRAVACITDRAVARTISGEVT